MGLPFPFDQATAARIQELGKILAANRGAKAHYEKSPIVNAIRIRQCDQRIEAAMAELDSLDRAAVTLVQVAKLTGVAT